MEFFGSECWKLSGNSVERELKWMFREMCFIIICIVSQTTEKVTRKFVILTIERMGLVLSTQALEFFLPPLLSQHKLSFTFKFHT